MLDCLSFSRVFDVKMSLVFVASMRIGWCFDLGLICFCACNFCACATALKKMVLIASLAFSNVNVLWVFILFRRIVHFWREQLLSLLSVSGFMALLISKCCSAVFNAWNLRRLLSCVVFCIRKNLDDISQCVGYKKNEIEFPSQWLRLNSLVTMI